jgi:Cu2+-exporting ATPase
MADIVEHPGAGMTGRLDGEIVRLGRRDWVGGDPGGDGSGNSEIWLKIGEALPRRFVFADTLRADARETVDALKDAGLDIALLSGDRPDSVAAVAAETGIADWQAGQSPSAKAVCLAGLASAGRRALMVGDGINDTAALASAYVSMSPSSAADISQTAADIVFTGKRLAPVAMTLGVARAAHRLVLQNFAMAIAYNTIAIPIAVLGHATPLIAAIAMSGSSIAVTANALRLRLLVRRRPAQPSASRPSPRPAEVTT